MPIKVIAARMGCWNDTVKAALKRDTPPKYERPPGESMVDAVEPRIRESPDLIAAHWELLERVGAVPHELVWDNAPAVGSWRSGKPRLAEDFEAFRRVLGVAVHPCKPSDPEATGLVERTKRY
jgi:transposase